MVGVAIMTSELEKHLIDELDRRNVPMVFLDVGSVRTNISNIRVDYAQGINEAVEHLLALGHRRRFASWRGRRTLSLPVSGAQRFSADWRASVFRRTNNWSKPETTRSMAVYRP